MNDDFVPSETLRRSIKLWWLLAGLMIAGGLVGIFITRIHKPVFESQAAITTSIDYAYAGRLTDVEEDQLVTTIGDLISSTGVFELVIHRAAEKSISISFADIENRFSKSRQAYRWELAVRDSDPVMAQTLNQIWMESAMQAVTLLRERSLDSLHYQTAQSALENCFSQTVVLDPVSASCSLEQISKIRQVLEQTAGDAKNMTLPKSILLSKISAQITQDATLPATPVLFKQNINTLIGVIVGLITGFGIMVLWNPKPK